MIDRQFDEQLLSVRDEFLGKIHLCCLDTDLAENLDVCRECRVTNMPAFACFIGGDWVETVTGCRREHELRERFTAWLRKAELTTPEDATSGL